MNNFKQKVKAFVNRYFIEAFTGMAQGLFATLIAGLIIKQIGMLIGDNIVGQLLIVVGNIASSLTGAGIGIGIATKLKSSNLVVFTAMVAGILGANSGQLINISYIINDATLNLGNILFKPGDPIGAYVCSIIAIEVGNLVSGKTKVDIVVVPLVMMITAVTVVVSLCPPIIWLAKIIGEFINTATTYQPLLMGVVIAVVVGILLTMPTSSAAICISIGINGIAGGAAVVGCCCHMVGFAVSSFKDNGWSGLISQGLGTSMLQIPNVMRKPIIMVPMIIASAVCGALSTTLFQLQCSSAGSGMGTSGLVGVFGVIEASSGLISPVMLVLGIVLLMFILPAVISLGVTYLFRRKGLIVESDMKI